LQINVRNILTMLTEKQKERIHHSPQPAHVLARYYQISKAEVFKIKGIEAPPRKGRISEKEKPSINH